MSSDDRTDSPSADERVWVALDRYLAGDADAEDVRLAREWLADPERAATVEELRRIRETVGRRPQVPDVDAAWDRLRAVLEASPRDARPLPASGTKPSVRRLAVPHRSDRRRTRWIAGGIAAAAAIVAVALHHGASIGASRQAKAARALPMSPPRVFAAARGQRTVLRLIDGTHVTLAADSRLVVPTSFDSTERTVIVEGEAYFDVVHDSRKPFLVRARNAVVHDLGTRFVVRAYPSERVVSVIVTGGTVRLRDRSAPAESGALLAARSIARIDSLGSTSVRVGVDTASYTGWMSGTLAFDATRLSDVAAELSRWYDVDVRVPDPVLAARRVTASIAEQPLGRLLDHLSVTLDVHAIHEGRTITLTPIPTHDR